MIYSHSGGRPRPPIYDIDKALTSIRLTLLLVRLGEWRGPRKGERLPKDWLRPPEGRFLTLGKLGSLRLWAYLDHRAGHTYILVTLEQGSGRGSMASAPVYCSCPGFQTRLASEDRPVGCAHIYALAESLRRGEHISELELDVRTLKQVLSEALSEGRSPTLLRLAARVNEPGA